MTRPLHPNRSRPELPDALLLECVVTTRNADGTTNVSPMGPIADPDFSRVLLRPFQPSTTLDNLRHTRTAVVHVTDDVLLIARAALGRLPASPPTRTTPDGRGAVLVDACRWRQIEAVEIDDRQQRAEVLCRGGDGGRLRDFVGFNRAMHAVIEATILATRLQLLPRDEVIDQMERLASPVEKTGGRREREAFALVWGYVHDWRGEPERSET